MLSEMDMANIAAEPDRKKREEMIEQLSGEDARKMFKSLVGAARRMHDAAWGRGER